MRHANNHLFGTVGSGAFDGFIQHRDQAFSALQTESLGTWVFAVEMALQTFRSGQTLQQGYLFRRIKHRSGTLTFESVQQPLALGKIGDMHDFGAYGAAVGFFQIGNNIA